MHRRPQDYTYFRRLQPSIFKIMDGGVPDYQWAKDNLHDSLVVARDWALSEQHSDMLKDPVATGKRHAQEWNQHQQRLGFNKAKTLICGINEPQIWNPGVAEALRSYTIALCNEATVYGLCVGAMQLSVGWPANTGPDTPPDWSPFHGVDNAIRHNNGALIVHEYWADRGPKENWGWWGGRALKCPWQVPIVIGECGVDMFVRDASVLHQARGWRGRMEPQRYAAELAEYCSLMSVDSRFKGCAVFASDYANREWFSFDVEPAYDAILATPIPQPPKPQPPNPGPTPPPTTELVHPLPGSSITQNFYEESDAYLQYGFRAHNGTDLGGQPLRTPVRSIAAGIVVWSDFDPGYGHYVRVAHDYLDCYVMYCHLDEAGATVGAPLGAGDTVGLLGSSGNSTGAHLHIEVRLQNKDGTYREDCPMSKGRVDPRTWAAMYGLKL
jgi:murein DD-endopeptidase MepM/ murein hydrolase activator NlpD